MFKKTKNVRLIILGVLVIVTIFQTYQANSNTSGDSVEKINETKELSLNNFVEKYKKNDFNKIEIINDKQLVGYTFLGTGVGNSFMIIQKTLTEKIYNTFESEKPTNTSLTDIGINLNGKTEINIKTEDENFFSNVLKDIVPLLIFFGLFLVLMKFALPKSGGLPFNTKTGKENIKMKTSAKFKDVAGMAEVKEELSEVVDYLKNPKKYQKVGARHPKGVLLYGQPGSGKTLLARAVAGEASVPFFSVSGSEFMEMLVGMGAAKVRNLFQKAKAAGSAIIFIDEIDAIGRKRGLGHTGGHQEQEQTLNQILTEMDGFDNKTNVIVIAATNRPDILDPALLRAGRFDRKIMVSAPTYEEREEIFRYYLKNKKIEKKLNLESLIKRTSGLVGADIENIVNEAALKLAKLGKNTISAEEFEYALEKVLMGPERKVKSMKEKEKQIIAFHELGHAVTSHLLPEADNVEKITIVRRGQALGATRKIPEEDKYLYSKTKILEETISLLGGRAAEEVFFGKEEVTTGASNDFEVATKMISDMIMKYGMDEEIGTIMYFDKSKEEYLPYKTYSEKTAEKIDNKIKYYMSYCYKRSKEIVSKNKDLIKEMSKTLLKKEYITKDEFQKMMKIKKTTKKSKK
ncbi:MAG TPA: ATP-dependent zinc metalloprotease FtsH [Candidatus Absconditabacterales bacterium]|nr:ATP-dependent zinc metalloprotease FtsH [Candidatus Absconditabacterales bacterium]